jgi:hypothetical protein
MRRLPAVLQRVEFHLLWLLISLILFSAPVALMASRPSAEPLMLVFFVPWLASLVVLFIVSRSYQPSGGNDDHGPRPPEA